MSSTYYNSYSSFDAYPHSHQSASTFSAALFRRLDPVVLKHLRRVYTSLLTALLAATLGSVATLHAYSRRLEWPVNFASFLTVPVLLAFYWQHPQSKWRSSLFHLFAFLDGAAAAPLLALVSSVDPRIPTVAFVAAAAVFACCSISAIFARRGSYLFLGSFCLTGLFGLLVISWITSIWSSFVPFSIVLYGGLLIFCGFVLYDTQAIIEKAHAGERDHIKHALDLLINFIAIFKRTAIIMAKNQVQRQHRDENNRKRRCSN